MSTRTTRLKLLEPAVGDRPWGPDLNANWSRVEAQSPIAALSVVEAEVPSASLNVTVNAGTFPGPDGVPVAYAGATVAVPASAATYLYLTHAGTLAQASSLPTTTAIVPLALVTAGATTITSIADARATARTYAPTVYSMSAAGTIPIGPTVVLCDATTAAFTATLPAVDGHAITVIKTDASAHAVTLGGTVNGAANYALSAQYARARLVRSGGAWYLLGT